MMTAITTAHSAAFARALMVFTVTTPGAGTMLAQAVCAGLRWLPPP
jgi:hypothetical protein